MELITTLAKPYRDKPPTIKGKTPVPNLPQDIEDVDYLFEILPIWRMWRALDKKVPPSWLLKEPQRLFWGIIEIDNLVEIIQRQFEEPN